MRRPTIKQARAIAEDRGARQVIVLVFGPDGAFAGSSYGVDKADCQRIARLLDEIVDRLEAGDLPSPVLR